MRRKNNLSEEEEQKMLAALLGRNVPVRRETALKPEGEEENDGIPSDKEEEQESGTGAEPVSDSVPARRISSKQRRASLDEYKEAFMCTPRIDDRKPVFISREKRDRLNRIVGLFGDNRMNVSGIGVKLTAADYFRLLTTAHKAGTSPSEYMRECFRNGHVKERLSKEHTGHVRQLCGMANNLNQLARKANSGGYSEVGWDCKVAVAMIHELISKIGI